MSRLSRSGIGGTRTLQILGGSKCLGECTGINWKCLVCSNYDLCEACERSREFCCRSLWGARNEHDMTHPLVKVLDSKWNRNNFSPNKRLCCRRATFEFQETILMDNECGDVCRPGPGPGLVDLPDSVIVAIASYVAADTTPRSPPTASSSAAATEQDQEQEPGSFAFDDMQALRGRLAHLRRARGGLRVLAHPPTSLEFTPPPPPPPPPPSLIPAPPPPAPAVGPLGPGVSSSPTPSPRLLGRTSVRRIPLPGEESPEPSPSPSPRRASGGDTDSTTTAATAGGVSLLTASSRLLLRMIRAPLLPRLVCLVLKEVEPKRLQLLKQRKRSQFHLESRLPW
ncbi:hypothetical protein Pelo_19015 [Pelomyxa schiedti]|nr:hypothetical protein Pelo_19015 [Pelomyxa schiedti]